MRLQSLYWAGTMLVGIVLWGLSSDAAAENEPPLLDLKVDTARGLLIDDGVVIVSPSAGDVFQSGDQVSVTVDSVASFEADDVLLGSKFAVTEMTGPPFTSSFEIPLHFVGRFGISAYATDDQGNIALSAVVELDVEAPADLLDLAVNPDIVFLRGATDTRNLWVVGQFADGVDRTMTRHIGTSFTSLDPSVAEVTSDGKVIPQGVGTATIVVQNGEISGTMTVEVLSF